VTRLLLLSLGLLMATGLAAAQTQSRAHMEACTQWKSEDGHIGTRNDCDRPIAIKFLAEGSTQVIEADIPPGGWFDTNLADGTIEGFLFTVCPLGYVPSVPFSMKDKTPILESLYNCLPAGRPGV
jgi:hypothetical protein